MFFGIISGMQSNSKGRMFENDIIPVRFVKHYKTVNSQFDARNRLSQAELVLFRHQNVV